MDNYKINNKSNQISWQIIQRVEKSPREQPRILYSEN